MYVHTVQYKQDIQHERRKKHKLNLSMIRLPDP